MRGTLARRILQSPNLRRLLLAFLGFNAAEYATWIAILLYAYQASGPGVVGVVALVQLGPAAILAPLAASAADRYPRHRVLAAGYFACAVGMAATAISIASAAPAPIVYVIAALGGAALVVVRPAQSALIPALAETPDEVTAAYGAAQVVEGAGIVLGPAVVAVTLTVANLDSIFAIAAAGLLLGGFLVLGVRPWSGADEGADRGGPAEPAGPMAAAVPVVVASFDPSAAVAAAPGFLSGLRAVLDDGDARLVVGLMSARMVMVGAADVLFVLMALDLLHMGEPGAGILNAAFGAGFIAGGALSFALAGRGGLSVFATVGAIAWGVALGLSGALASAPLAVLLLAGGSAGLAIVDLAGRTILQRAVRDDVLAGVFGVQEGLAMVALAIGSLGVPILAGIVGLGGAIVLVGAFLPLVVLVAWRPLRSLDARAAPRVREIALLRRTGLFGSLPGPQLESVVRHASWLSVPAGTMVIREGDRGDRYYVLESGRMSVTRGDRHVRDLTSSGDGFGEIALLRDVPRTASVVATSPSTLLVIERAAFLGALTGNPAIAALADQAARAASM